MGKRYDVIVIGGGVIGCSIAFQLSKQGRSVLIIEKDTIASKASRAAAGMLGFEMEETFHQSASLFDLAKKSREMFPEVEREIKALSGIDIAYCQNGFLKVARTDAELSQLQHEFERHLNQGIKSVILGPDEVKTLEPALADSVKAGLSVRNGANVSAKQLTRGFAYAAVKLGADLLENTEVSDLIVSADQVIGVKTLERKIFANEVIVAAGAWSEDLLNKRNIHLQTYPVKGECISVQTTSNLLTQTLFIKDCYIVPKPGGEIIIGATEIPHTFDKQVNLASVSKLMELAIRLIPSLQETALKNVWSGIRPQTITGKPYVERNTFFNNLTIATGHYRNGVLLAPVTGVLVANLLEAEEQQIPQEIRS